MALQNIGGRIKNLVTEFLIATFTHGVLQVMVELSMAVLDNEPEWFHLNPHEEVLMPHVRRNRCVIVIKSNYIILFLSFQVIPSTYVFVLICFALRCIV